MAKYIVKATIEVEADDRAKLQSMLDAGTAELPALASRYGFTVSSASATVEE